MSKDQVGQEGPQERLYCPMGSEILLDLVFKFSTSIQSLEATPGDSCRSENSLCCLHRLNCSISSGWSCIRKPAEWYETELQSLEDCYDSIEKVMYSMLSMPTHFEENELSV